MGLKCSFSTGDEHCCRESQSNHYGIEIAQSWYIVANEWVSRNRTIMGLKYGKALWLKRVLLGRNRTIMGLKCGDKSEERN